MSRCANCRYVHDYPMSCIDDQEEFPFCGFKQKTEQQIKVDKMIKEIRNRIESEESLMKKFNDN